MKKTLLALIVILAVASMFIGGTFASFCDTEMVSDSAFTTGDLDLKVAKAGDLEYYDDEPYGTGLFPKENDDGEIETVPCFKAEEEPGVGFAESYTCNLKLWNAGTTHGKAYVHIRGVGAEPPEHAAGLLDGTTVTLWYDQNDDDSELNSEGEIDEAEVVTGTLGGLDCQVVPLESVWLLPANELRNLQIVIDPPAGAPGDSLTFHIQFNLAGFYFDDDDDMVGVGFCDTEICLDNCLEVKE